MNQIPSFRTLLLAAILMGPCLAARADLPVITTEPTNVTAPEGSTVSFTVVATGTALTYHWKQAGVSVPGATATLTLTNISDSEAGGYTVVVTNSSGAVTSTPPAVLIVTHPPVITSQPASQVANTGDEVLFFVGVNGATPFGYQWQTNGFALTGETESSLDLNPVQDTDALSYSVFVTNSDGSLTSTNALLTVVEPLLVGTPPITAPINTCTNVTLSVLVYGSDPSLQYQWYFGPNMTPIGTNGPTLSLTDISFANAGDYSVTVSNSAGSYASASGTLTVQDPPPIIINGPSNIVVQTGPGATNCGTTATWTPPTAEDNCPGVTLTSNYHPGDSFPVGTTTVTYTATDSANQSANYSFTVTVQDTTPPQVVFNPISVQLDANGNYTLTPGDVANISAGSSDNCTSVSASVSPTNFTFCNVGSTTVTLTVTDTNGNSASSNGTITVLAPTNVPSVVYVDASYTNCGPLTFPNTNGIGAYYLGYNAFATIQAGVNAVASGGTVNVAAGVYVENLTISQPLNLVGPNSAINPNTGTRVAEAVIEPATSDANPYDANSELMVYVSADQVSISGFTVDGSNPSLTTNGVLVGTNYVNAAEGIVSYDGVGLISISNNIVRDTAYTGVDFYNYNNGGGATATNYIVANRFDNLGAYGFGIGVLVYNNFYADICDNTMTNVVVGIQTGNFSQANPGTLQNINNNTIAANAVGIFFNLMYGTTSTFVVSNNAICFQYSTNAPEWDGMLISSIQDSVGVNVISNAISGTTTNEATVGYNTVGYNVWNTPTTAQIAISGGTVSNANYGVWVNDYDGYQSAGATTRAAVSGVNISGASLAGVYVQDDPRASTNGVAVQATVTGNTVISNSAVGVLIQGTNAGASVLDNTASITGNGVGISVDTGVALVESNDLSGNTVAGISVTNGAIVDAGNCTGTNVTGLGISTGGNNLSGYGFDSVAPWAVINGNAGGSPVVLADHDNFGAVAGDNVAEAFSGAVEYSQSPAVMTAPANLSLVCASSVPAGATNLAGLTAQGGYYAGNAASVVFSDDTNFVGSGVIHRTYTVTDGCGVASTGVQTITVSDTIPPTITGTPSNILVGTGPGNTNCSQVVYWTEPTAGDNCAVASFTSNYHPGDTFPVGTTTVTYTAVDPSSNTTTSSFTVTVQDTTPPQVVFNPIAVQLDANGNYTLTPGDVANISAGSSDNCTSVSASVSPTNFTFCNVGSNTVTLTVTDTNGNSASSNGTITVLAPTNVPSVVYVDASYTNCGPLTFPNTNGTGAYYLGFNAFVTIQAGLNAVATNGTVNVAPGTYNENPVFNQPVTLTSIGGNSASNTIIVIQPANFAGVSGGLTINASSVAVRGFSIVGLDAGDTSAPPTYGTASINILLTAPTLPAAQFTNIEIANNIIEVGAIGPYYSSSDGFGFETTYNVPGGSIPGGAWPPGTSPTVSLAGNINIHNNIFEPVDVPPAYDTPGNAFFINPAGSFTFESNTITGDFGNSTTEATNSLIAYNVIVGTSSNDSSGGIATWGYPDPAIYGQGTIIDNVITNIGTAIFVYDSENVTIENNLLNGDGVGISVLDSGYDPVYPAGTTVQILDNSLANDAVGVINTSSNSIPVAVSNWWGDISGPSSLALNYYGTGSSVSSNLTFVPWLDSGANAITNGFAPASPAPAYPPVQMVFTTEPVGAALGSPLSLQPVVSVEDTNGNVTPWANPAVALAIGANPGGGVLTGTDPETAAGGVAAFTNLAITVGGGSGYTLVATAPSLAMATSSPFDIANPLPIITNLTPAYAVAGDPGFNLTVSGTNFVADSVVRWNGANLATTFSSATEISAPITAADIASPATASVTVFNPAPDGGESTPPTSFTVYPVPTVVYVNASYTSSGPDDGHLWGYDAFNTVQSGVNRVAPGGTVNVAAGTYNEAVSANKAVALLGANQGVAGCGVRGAESVINAGAGNAITLSANNVIVDGFELNGLEAVQAYGYVGIALRNNVMNAGAVGVDVRNIATAAGEGFAAQNNCITLAGQIAGSAPTVGIAVSGVTGVVAPLLQTNNIQGAFYGYLLYSLNAAAPTLVQGGLISGVMQGVAVLNLNPNTLSAYDSSTFTVDGVAVSGFAGNYPSSPNNNLQAGIYVFTGGTSPAAAITGTITNVTIVGAGKISPDSAGLDFADFSTGAGVRQQISVQNSVISTNSNRGIFVSGTNAVAWISGCTLLGNGFDPYGTGGNPGFGIIARNNSQVTVTQCFLANPATVTAPYTVTALEADANTGPLGPTLVASDCSIVNNGSPSGQLAGEDAGTLNASGNWWGTTTDTAIAALMTGVVDFTPYLDSGTDTNAVEPGFQGDFSVLHVTTLGAQTGVTGRIQEGINLVADGKVFIEAGDYVENILANKDNLELAGAGQAAVTIVPALSAPNPDTNDTSSLVPGASEMLLVSGNNVKIHDLTLEGNNPNLTSGVLSGGVDVDARNGIIEDYDAGLFNGLEVCNVTVRDIYLRGIYASSGGTFYFHNNTVQNVQGDPDSVAMFNYGGSGVFSNNVVSDALDAISANWSSGTIFVSNTITASGSGVHTDNSSGPDLLEGNNVSAMQAGGYGVWVFAPYGSVTVSSNTISGCNVGLASAGQSAAVTPVFMGNTVTAGAGAGNIGVYETTSLFGYGYSDVSSGFQGNSIQGTTYGFYLEDTSSNNLSAAITTSNSVTGNQYGVYVTGAPAKVKIESTDLRNNSFAAIHADGGATVDAGNCGADVTGLGASAGGNLLTGYGFDNVAPWAVENLNGSGPAVLADQDSFGAGVGNNLAALFSGSVTASQSGGLLAQYPPAQSVQCLVSVPAAAANLAEFEAIGGLVSATEVASVASSDSVLSNTVNNRIITRTYTITDDCGQIASGNQTITVDDNIPPVVTTWPTNRTLDVGGACNVAVPDLTLEVVASDNCGAVHVTQNPPSGTLVSLGTTNVTVVVADDSTNSVSTNVVLTIIDTQPAPAATFVDANYANLPAGTVVKFPYGGTNGSDHYVGCDAFATIQAGINRVAAGGTVEVAGGRYVGEVTINEPLTLWGPNATNNPNTAVRAVEAVIQPDTSDPEIWDSSAVVLVSIGTNHVSVKGFTIDGYNPDLAGVVYSAGYLGGVPSGTNYLGVYYTSGTNLFNAAVGIGDYTGDSALRIENNIIRNDAYAGVDLESDGPGSPPTTNSCIKGNLVENMDYNTEGYGTGISLYNNYYAEIAGNDLTNVAIGISPQSYFLANPGDVRGQGICSNQVSASLLGIWLNLAYEAASTFEINGNTSVFAPTNGSVLYGPAEWDGIEITSIQNAVNVIATNNTIIGTTNPVGYNTVGYNVWNTPTTAQIAISGGTVSNANYGVWVNDYDGYQSAGATTRAAVSGVNISGASLAGVYVQDDPRASTNGVAVQATVTGNTVISNSAVGVLIQGTNAGASVLDNTASITGNGVGISVDTGVALVESNDLSGNTVAGISVTNGAIVDAGNCTGTNVTGLGISTGGNNLSGYGFDSVAPWAVINGNAGGSPVVLADHDNFGAVAGDNVAGAFSGAVEYSQSPAVMTAPANLSLVCASSVPAGATNLAGLAAQGGYYAGNAASVVFSDDTNFVGSGVIHRTYTVTDGCGVASTGVQTITVSDTIPPVFTLVPTNAVYESDIGQTSKSNVTWLVSATDNCDLVSLISIPPSGSTFPEGTTTVTNIATDASGNTNVATFTVTVLDPPVITSAPVSVTTNIGSTVTFNVAATGTAPLSYQWQQNNLNILGANSSSLTLIGVSDSDAGSYQVIVTNIIGVVTSTPPAILTLLHPPVIPIGGQPSNVTVTLGQSASFSVSANGASPFGYQWRKQDTNLNGATNRVYSLSHVADTDAGNYSVFVTNMDGSATSREALLTVIDPPVITNQPIGLTNDAQTTAIFTVGASGTAPLSYQWVKNGTNALSDGGKISGSTNATLTISNVLAADMANYTVIISNAATTVTSTVAVLVVIDPVILTEPASLTQNAGTTAAFNVSAAGTSITYQWLKNGLGLTNGGNVLGATSSNLVLNSIADADAATYSVVVSNSLGGFLLSSNATLAVVDPPVITNQPVNVTANAGATAHFIVGASGTAPGYQWFKGVSPIFGATTAILTLTNVSDGDAASYYVVLTNAAGTATSSNATLTVIDPPFITSQPAGRTNNAATTATFSVAVTGTAPFSFQWVKNLTNFLSNGANISGATNSTLTISNVLAADQGDYTVVVGNPAQTVTSSNAFLVVIDPVITGQPTNVSAIVRSTVVFSVAASGTPALSYQWQMDGFDLSDGFGIGGSHTTTLSITNITDSDAGNYTVVVSNSIGSVTSAPAILITYPPLITVQPSTHYVNLGQPTAFSVSVNGALPFMYQWQKNDTNIGGETNRILDFGSAAYSDTANYRVIVGNPDGTETSIEAGLTVVGPTVPIMDVVAYIDDQASVSLTSTPGFNYAIQASTNLTDWITLETNTAPFTYLDTNAGSFGARYYRGLYLP